MDMPGVSLGRAYIVGGSIVNNCVYEEQDTYDIFIAPNVFEYRKPSGPYVF